MKGSFNLEKLPFLAVTRAEEKMMVREGRKIREEP